MFSAVDTSEVRDDYLLPVPTSRGGTIQRPAVADDGYLQPQTIPVPQTNSVYIDVLSDDPGKNCVYNSAAVLANTC